MVEDHALGVDHVELESIVVRDVEGSGQDIPPAPANKLEPPESIDASIVYRLYRGTNGQVAGRSHRVWVDFPALQLCWAAYDKPAQPHHRVSLLDLAACSCNVSNNQDADVFDGDVVRVEIWGFCGSERLPRPDAGCGQGCVPESYVSPLAALATAGVAEPAALCHAAPPREADGHLGQAAAAPGHVVQDGIGQPGRAQHWQPQHDLAQKLAGTLLLTVEASAAVKEFAEALQRLLASRDSEGKTKLEFIQRSLFQYLWRHQGVQFSEQASFEAQAVLAFNLDPKEGVKYLKGKLGKTSDIEVGQWLAECALNGGLDPTLLGNYFSRMDTIEVFKAFVRSLDFSGMDLVVALRKLFDTFKPGGEGQVISRIIELFAETYFVQWSENQESTMPRTAYAAADSVMATAFSLIMLNTGLHVASKKVNKKGSMNSCMTADEFVENTRRVVGEEEVPEDALLAFYTAVKEAEISMQPMPRVAFARLPVQPDIAGWLIVVLGPHDQRRYWAVLALQRMYLFSDASDVDPADACDLKDAFARSVLDDAASRNRLAADLHGSKHKCLCFARSGRGQLFDTDLESRAFEVCQKVGQGFSWMKKFKPSSRLALVAESPELMEKWVSLIDSGPY